MGIISPLCMRVCTLHTVIQPGCMMMIDTLNDTGSSATITPKDLSGGTMSPTPSHFILMSPLDCRCALSGPYPLQHPHARSRNSSVHIWSSSLQRHLDSGDIAGTRERGGKKSWPDQKPKGTRMTTPIRRFQLTCHLKWYDESAA